MSICFFDTETLSHADEPFNNVVDVGAYRYFAEGARPHILSYAIDDGPVRVLDRYEGLRYKDLPLDLRQFYNRAAQRGDAHFVTWNAAFDRLAWNTMGGPEIGVRMIKDAMAQAVASNLPPSLDGAARYVGKTQKDHRGKALIKMFATGDYTPADRPEEWEEYKGYARDDTAALRDIWQATRPLSDQEWEEYFASEIINDRGMPIDVEFAKRAALVAAAQKERANEQIKVLTGGVVTKVTQVKRLAEWVYDNLDGHSEAREAMTKQVREDPESEGDYIVTKLGLSRDRIAQVLAYFNDVEDKHDGLTDLEIAICDALEIRQWDGSTTPGKFGKMLIQQVDGKLKGSYAFNGAPQTGRFSSRGVQVHNLIRMALDLLLKQQGAEDWDGAEERAIEMINNLEV